MSDNERIAKALERSRADLHRLDLKYHEAIGVPYLVDMTLTDAQIAMRDAAALLRSEPVGDNHCKDCCCARSWEALGITAYTGRSIPEHIEALREENERLRALSEPVGEPVAWRWRWLDQENDWHVVANREKIPLTIRHGMVESDPELRGMAEPLYATPPAPPAAPEAKDWQKPEVAQPDKFRWDESVEQIHRELAGEVALPEAKEPEPCPLCGGTWVMEEGQRCSGCGEYSVTREQATRNAKRMVSVVQPPVSAAGEEERDG